MSAVARDGEAAEIRHGPRPLQPCDIRG